MSMNYPPEMRERLMRFARRANFQWAGRIGYLEFFGKILNLKAMPSSDSRFKTADEDLWQHTVNNFDWDEDFILSDPRFDPMQMSDDSFGAFLAQALSIDAHTEVELEEFGKLIKPVVSAFGYMLVRRIEYGVFEGLAVRTVAHKVNNQGRGHSQNPAALEHRGFYFRSQPEVQLFEALMQDGYLLAPLPVFVQKTADRYVRCEPDFIVVRYGIWAVVEVDGQNWHQETPQQAHARLQGFEDQGARVIRVPANVASGPEWAKRTVEYIGKRFESFKLAR